MNASHEPVQIQQTDYVQATFPAVEPYDTGTLDVGAGHRLYWECCRNPDGKPAVFLHGGPGSGCTPGQRRFFDPDAYRVVLFDQRGSGRSRPLASDEDADLSTNTTAQLVSDIEALREHHGIERWAVLGLSWGSTLGLAYAETYPQRVDALVLGAVTTTSRREVEWITGDVGRIFPQRWDRFAAAIPDALRHLPLVDAYATLLFDADAAVRLVTHYWRNAAFLEDNQLLENAPLLDGIPGVLIHGRYDVSGPLETAWLLSQRWTTSRLRVIDDAGHGGGDSFNAAITDAMTQLAANERRSRG